MSIFVCSLIYDQDVDGPQPVPADGDYHLLRFPFGGSESSDVHGMHPGEQPDGPVAAYPDLRSGLIWPAVHGWADLTAMVQWESGGYTELRDQFVRDPLALTSDPVDTTGTEHRPPSPGMQCFAKHHAIFVHPGMPLGLRATHNDNQERRVVHAQFKVVIQTDVAGGP